MKNNQLEKALKMVNRTGEKMLIMDKDSDKVFALMDLDDYEFLLDHDSEMIENYDEEEMMNKIDRDLKYWREHHEDEEEDFDNFDSLEDEDWIPEPEEINEHIDLGDKENKEEPLNIIPLDQRNGQPLNILKEESLDDLPADDLEENDKFYLEPVE
jgi:PHD/YefM family antitoxin component YafN of YafNO toxin-antitoxin module